MKTIQSEFTKIISSIFIFVFFVSCSKEVDVVATPIDNSAAFKGSFVNSAHPTSGNVTVNKEKTKLNFTDFKSDSGPDLDIYLVSNLSNVKGGFIDLGDIKGINGNYTYDIPANTDFAVYKYVVVWCKAFNVNFGYATLMP